MMCGLLCPIDECMFLGGFVLKVIMVLPDTVTICFELGRWSRDYIHNQVLVIGKQAGAFDFETPSFL